jgi:MFS family permease
LSYLGELKTNWREASAAMIGMGFGYSLYMYSNAIFGPPLLKEFGWSKAQFALLGTTLLVNVICLPAIGRLTDLFGVRKVAVVGFVVGPLIFLGLSRIGGNFAIFLTLSYLLAILFGTTTSSTVFGRLVAQRFDRARGLALSLMACAPAAAAAIATPIFGALIEARGWRTSYVALAAVTVFAGVIALLLVPSRTADEIGAGNRAASPWRAYPEIMRAPTFWILIVGMLLCNLTTTVFSSQLKLILLDRAVPTDRATGMISLYIAGMLAGRLVSGLALDRFPAHIVSGISMAMPAIGIFILASGLTHPLLLLAAVATVGMAVGAELNIGGYLVMRFFRTEIYSTVYSIASAMIGLSSAGGSLLLSATLAATGGYALFLWISGTALLAGALLFLSLGRYRPVNPVPAR